MPDGITVLGVSDGATDGYDALYDHPEPPMPPGGDYVSAFFDHPDWNAEEQQFNSDIRQKLATGESRSWTMTVFTNGSGIVTLEWPQMPDYSFTIKDQENGIETALQQADSYSYESDGLGSLK